MKVVFNIIFHAIFWLWNIAFLLIVYAGIFPQVGTQLIAATFTGELPSEFFLTFVALIAVPTVCTLVGALRFRKQPLQLLRLFYGVEAPLFLLCLIRLFLLRELTPASIQIVGTLVVCIAAFLLDLLYGYIGQQESIATKPRRFLAWLQVGFHTLMLLTGLYAGVMLLFYAMPTFWVVLLEFFKFRWLEVLVRMLTWDNLAWSWWLPLGFLLFCFSSTLFVVMPSAFASLYLYSGRRVWKAFATQYGRNRAIASSITVVVAWLTIFLILQQQPQLQAFSLLKNPAQTDSSRQALLAKSDTIRTGLLNAYLSSYRYLSNRQENNHIRAMYSSVFGLPESSTQVLQNFYNQLMSPFLYNGSYSDGEKAAKLYAEFFDVPIQKAEQEAIQHALQSTANREEAKAGLLNINQKKVWLRSQQITVKPQGDWADIELHEIYDNQTTNLQEVFYSFSLPESATITGLWLGDTDNRQRRFPFTVSPRGAAQKVYTAQVRERVDPALLEQVGPRHYRLRAFPVPAKPSAFRGNVSQQGPTEMHLWLTYKVMQQDAGWAMPQLGEKRNIFWTKDTKRIYNGKAVKSSEDWLPSFISAEGKRQPTLHQVNLPSGYRISVKPLGNNDYSFPQNKRFAIVLDSSRSMASHTQQLSQTFRWLKEKGFADNSFANNDADLYLSASTGAQPKRIDDIQRFDVAKMTFYGTLQPKQILQQFAQLRGDTPYDAVLVVTDEGSYELSDDKTDVPAIPASLWMVHIGGKLPPAYDDATLRAIQDSRGGVSTKIPEVMQRLATQAALGDSVVGVVDGYAWSMEKPLQEASVQVGAISRNGFEPVAARQLVLGLSKEKAQEQLVQLDTMHTVAKSFGIVTPYSSMIVLVNDQQREALKKAEQESDRFNRKVENGNEQLSQPFNPFNISGVPEPEEWMLMGMIAIALVFISRRQQPTVS
ncbi:MAG TPA: PEP-CTERM sorting domain-containing protein [Cyanobacteria bacterium UBA8543]|nr:PEP-CTERM sorting domain-containing protein [Cyanobacteria bacterium UBA8543]